MHLLEAGEAAVDITPPLGIDLGGDGVDTNDNMDPDTGPNNRQNYPVITDVINKTGGQTIVSGTLQSAPGTSFRLEFFANTQCDRGLIQGKEYLGTVDVTTEGDGRKRFKVTFPGQKRIVTATATRLGAESDPGDTSEFSASDLQVVGIEGYFDSTHNQNGKQNNYCSYSHQTEFFGND